VFQHFVSPIIIFLKLGMKFSKLHTNGFGRKRKYSVMNYMNELTIKPSMLSPVQLLVLLGIWIPNMDGSVVLTISMNHGR